jgi:hypothetical protein
MTDDTRMARAKKIVERISKEAPNISYEMYPEDEAAILKILIEELPPDPPSGDTIDKAASILADEVDRKYDAACLHEGFCVGARWILDRMKNDRS